MTSKDLKIQDMLRLEVAYKSKQSAAAFAAFSVFIFFYCFGCTKFKFVIQGSMLMVFIVSLLRLNLARKIRDAKRVTNRHWKIMVVYVWLNAIGWSLAFNLASYELKLSGIDFIIVTTMLAGFVAASLVTLAYDPLLFLPFQFLLLVPQLGIVLALYYGPEKINALPLIPIYLMYLVYQLRQLKDFRKQIIERLNYQSSLEDTNINLKESQEALISQTSKLIHTSRLAALGEMSAGIAHEVNNPLAIISGGIQQIERIVGRGELSTEKILFHSSKCLKSVDRVTKIINGLRHFAQQSDLNPKENVSLKNIVIDTNSFCSELLAARQIKLIIDSVPDILIECHPIHISQVLINLIKNAEDALEQETQTSERWIRITFEIKESFIFINVTNGGPKIPLDLQSKLFQPFFTTKAIGKGTGLGLSISHGLMREHKGDLVFDPAAEKTTFTLQLPVNSVSIG